ncbi:predicted protein [Lichtheimia corymbifera JMRC:FSU:9682]|uniref:Uncharacterized protein n=1 Tax=Lichtheimia corymbifera JMRC:FSU:9682 TaxID=1263082 RepID=A0A068RHC7_9FUNG|nr:predicted protein [Lichtheimia corymbifera JMRC:FSU:9682]
MCQQNTALDTVYKKAPAAVASASQSASSSSTNMAPILHLSPNQLSQFKHAGSDDIFDPDLIAQVENQAEKVEMTPEEIAEQEEATELLVDQMDQQAAAEDDEEEDEGPQEEQEEEETASELDMDEEDDVVA